MPGRFEELDVYRKARAMRRRVYRLIEGLPAEEKYNLADQMRRAALSVTNNIAEGHGSRSFKHNIAYLYRSRGSVFELLDDLSLCEDQAYFQPDHIESLRQDLDEVARLINGYINYLRKRLREVK